MVPMNVFDRLFETRIVDGTAQVVGSLCTDYSVSEDGLTYDFVLRDGVVFSNGNALTASDVQYSFERLLIANRENMDIPLEVAGAEALRNGEADSLEGFRVDDDTHFSITLSAIDGTLKHGLLLLQDKKHGLARYVNVYSIEQFSLGNVSLSDAGSFHNGFPVYSLSFVLPEDFPASYYPLQLSMASSTLSPFSDASASSASGTFSVEVRSTSGLAGNDNSSAWNYGASTWDYWYNYSIPAPAGTSAAERTVTLYLDDIRSKRGSAPTGVGLYLTIPYFGDPIPVTP